MCDISETLCVGISDQLLVCLSELEDRPLSLSMMSHSHTLSLSSKNKTIFSSSDCKRLPLNPIEEKNSIEITIYSKALSDRFVDSLSPSPLTTTVPFCAVDYHVRHVFPKRKITLLLWPVLSIIHSVIIIENRGTALANREHRTAPVCNAHSG